MFLPELGNGVLEFEFVDIQAEAEKDGGGQGWKD